MKDRISIWLAGLANFFVASYVRSRNVYEYILVANLARASNFIQSRKPNLRGGIGLVEVLVGASILSVAGVALVLTYGMYVKIAVVAPRPIQATFLQDEGLEAMRIIRDNSWTTISNLTLGTSYYLSFNASTTAWTLSTTPQMIDGIFDRTIVVSSVNRDVNSDIASSGTIDTNTKKITVSVSWLKNGATTTKQLVGYLTNLF